VQTEKLQDTAPVQPTPAANATCQPLPDNMRSVAQTLSAPQLPLTPSTQDRPSCSRNMSAPPHTPANRSICMTHGRRSATFPSRLPESSFPHPGSPSPCLRAPLSNRPREGDVSQAVAPSVHSPSKADRYSDIRIPEGNVPRAGSPCLPQPPQRRFQLSEGIDPHAGSRCLYSAPSIVIQEGCVSHDGSRCLSPGPPIRVQKGVIERFHSLVLPANNHLPLSPHSLLSTDVPHSPSTYPQPRGSPSPARVFAGAGFAGDWRLPDNCFGGPFATSH
jgi:hypothetical protein